jgi:hypothetical protein
MGRTIGTVTGIFEWQARNWAVSPPSVLILTPTQELATFLFGLINTISLVDAALVSKDIKVIDLCHVCIIVGTSGMLVVLLPHREKYALTLSKKVADAVICRDRIHGAELNGMRIEATFHAQDEAVMEASRLRSEAKEAFGAMQVW